MRLRPLTESTAPIWLCDEASLVGAALALGARNVRGWSTQEENLVAKIAFLPSRESTAQLVQKIQNGLDPLGSALCLVRSPEARRPLGATYTPMAMVSSMLGWAKSQAIEPARVIDPGVGSGRFLMASGRRFKFSELVGIEIDPLPAMIARANLAASGFAERSRILVQDYRSVVLPSSAGPTLYVGNPPYVRHHLIEPSFKQWLTATAKELGYEASQLSGLHVYFFLATAVKARPGDFGLFVTASEWLDVNYGRLVRDLFLNQLGGQSLTVVEPTAQPFEDAATTAAISTFVVGSRPLSISVQRVNDSKILVDLASGQQIHRGRLESESRWSHLTRKQRSIPEGYIELGELCRVHRGQVTGANHIWIAGPHSRYLPTHLLFRTVTRAKELFRAQGVLSNSSTLRDVIDIPADLDILAEDDRKAVVRFLHYAKEAGADSGYVARTRRAWWSVGCGTQPRYLQHIWLGDPLRSLET
jgi:methylase of polypeptide subunit release factors